MIDALGSRAARTFAASLAAATLFATATVLAGPGHQATADDGGHDFIFYLAQPDAVVVHHQPTGYTDTVARSIRQLTVAPSGDLLAAIGADDVRVIRPGGRATILEGDETRIRSDDDNAPAWTGDSKMFVYGKSGHHIDSRLTKELWVADLDTGRVRILAESKLPDVFGNTEWFYRGFDVDPSSRQVGAIAVSANGSKIVTFNLDSGIRTTVYEHEYVGLSNLSWHPDGTTVAYIAKSSGQDYSVRTLDLQSGTVTVLDVNSRRVDSLTWSPDGDTIAYATVDEIVLVDTDGHRNSLSRPTDEPVRDVGWVNNDQVVYASRHGLYTIDRSGSSTRLHHESTTSGRVTVAYGGSARWMPPPKTTITESPDAVTSIRHATFSFSSDRAQSTFECRINDQVWEPCTTPATYSGLSAGIQQFDVRAVDALGNVDPNPPRAAWSVEPVTFADVGSNHAFHKEIMWMVDHGITTGFPDDTFRPTNVVTRQALAAFLYRLAGEPPVWSVAGFSDVPSNHQFHDEIAWMVDEGITTGFDDGTFRPTQAVSRQAAMAFLYRAEGAPEVSPTNSFSDVDASHMFNAEISWGVREGITGGWADNTFRPGNDVTRQASAAFLSRLPG